jgi:hypothetical protein
MKKLYILASAFLLLFVLLAFPVLRHAVLPKNINILITQYNFNILKKLTTQSSDIYQNKLIKALAEDGEAESEFRYSQILLLPINAPSDSKEVFKWVKASAIQNYSNAQYTLAKFFYTGYGTEKNEDAGAAWLIKSAENGHVESIEAIAQFYEKGEHGFHKDSNEAYRWYLKGANIGDEMCIRWISFFYHVFSLDKDLIKESKISEDEKNLLVSIYNNAAQQKKDTPSWVFSWLGDAYHLGFGVKSNEVISFDWYLKSANEGNVYAANKVALDYLLGIGVKTNRLEALKWYRFSHTDFTSEKIEAFIDLFPAPNVKDETNQEYVKELQEYQSEPYSKYAGIKRLAGEMIAAGQGLKPDRGQAIKLFQQASDEGDASASFALGLIYDIADVTDRLSVKIHDSNKALNFYRKAVDGKNVKAMRFLAYNYYQGEGVEKDSSKAVEWLKKCSEYRDIDSYQELGLAYAYGDGVDQSDIMAAKWLRKAGYKSTYYASLDINIYYSNTDKFPDAETSETLAIHKKGIAGDIESQYLYGLALAEGRGVEQDESAAFEWFLKSAKKNYTKAMFRVGDAYKYGRGVEKNKDNAFEWLSNTIKTGDPKLDEYGYAVSWLVEEYDDGNVENEKIALEFATLAAMRGNYAGQYFLGCIYKNGSAGEINLSKALACYQLSSLSGKASWLKILKDCETKCSLKDKLEAYVYKHNYEIIIAQNTHDNSYLNTKYDPSLYLISLQKKALDGDRDLRYQFARAYEYGSGVDKNYAKAIDYYKLLDSNNDSWASSRIAELYLRGGYGIEQNRAEAAKWYLRASSFYKEKAEQGDAKSEERYASLLESAAQADLKINQQAKYSIGYRDAALWHMKAAYQGNFNAQEALSFMYALGRGVDQDDVEALAWAMLAATTSDDIFAEMYRDNLHSLEVDAGAQKMLLAKDRANDIAQKIKAQQMMK